MTRKQLEAALDAIEERPKNHVYASRKGICAATHLGKGRWVAFRRKGDVIQAEEVVYGTRDRYKVDSSIPADLAARAALMLDNL